MPSNARQKKNQQRATRTPAKSKRAGSARNVEIPIEIDDGSGGERTHRTLHYHKRPEKWTARDVLAVVREMAQTAADVQGKKITGEHFTLWFDAVGGGTQITVSQTFGAWAYLRGRHGFQIHPAAIGALLAISPWWTSTHLHLPSLIRPDAEAIRESYARMVKLHADLLADIAKKLDAGAGASR